MPISLNAISYVLASYSGWSYKASPYKLAEFCVTWGQVSSGWKTVSQPITSVASKSPIPIGTRDLQIGWIR